MTTISDRNTDSSESKIISKTQLIKWVAYLLAGVFVFFASLGIDQAWQLIEPSAGYDFLDRSAAMLDPSLPFGLLGLMLIIRGVSLFVTQSRPILRLFSLDVRDAFLCFMSLYSGFCLGFAVVGYRNVFLASIAVMIGGAILLSVVQVLTKDAQAADSTTSDGSFLRNLLTGGIFSIGLIFLIGAWVGLAPAKSVCAPVGMAATLSR
jgi:hypothetical protein